MASVEVYLYLKDQCLATTPGDNVLQVAASDNPSRYQLILNGAEAMLKYKELFLAVDEENKILEWVDEEKDAHHFSYSRDGILPLAKKCSGFVLDYGEVALGEKESALPLRCGLTLREYHTAEIFLYCPEGFISDDDDDQPVIDPNCPLHLVLEASHKGIRLQSEDDYLAWDEKENKFIFSESEYGFTAVPLEKKNSMVLWAPNTGYISVGSKHGLTVSGSKDAAVLTLLDAQETEIAFGPGDNQYFIINDGKAKVGPDGKPEGFCVCDTGNGSIIMSDNFLYTDGKKVIWDEKRASLWKTTWLPSTLKLEHGDMELVWQHGELALVNSDKQIHPKRRSTLSGRRASQNLVQHRDGFTWFNLDLEVDLQVMSGDFMVISAKVNDVSFFWCNQNSNLSLSNKNKNAFMLKHLQGNNVALVVGEKFLAVDGKDKDKKALILHDGELEEHEEISTFIIAFERKTIKLWSRHGGYITAKIEKDVQKLILCEDLTKEALFSIKKLQDGQAGDGEESADEGRDEEKEPEEYVLTVLKGKETIRFARNDFDTKEPKKLQQIFRRNCLILVYLDVADGIANKFLLNFVKEKVEELKKVKKRESTKGKDKAESGKEKRSEGKGKGDLVIICSPACAEAIIKELSIQSGPDVTSQRSVPGITILPWKWIEEKNQVGKHLTWDDDRLPELCARFKTSTLPILWYFRPGGRVISENLLPDLTKSHPVLPQAPDIVRTVQHVNHTHKLTLCYSEYNAAGSFGCDECRMPGKGQVYHCEQCKYDVHLECLKIAEAHESGLQLKPKPLFFTQLDKVDRDTKKGYFMDKATIIHCVWVSIDEFGVSDINIQGFRCHSAEHYKWNLSSVVEPGRRPHKQSGTKWTLFRNEVITEVTAYTNDNDGGPAYVTGVKFKTKYLRYSHEKKVTKVSVCTLDGETLTETKCNNYEEAREKWLGHVNKKDGTVGVILVREQQVEVELLRGGDKDDGDPVFYKKLREVYPRCDVNEHATVRISGRIYQREKTFTDDCAEKAGRTKVFGDVEGTPHILTTSAGKIVVGFHGNKRADRLTTLGVLELHEPTLAEPTSTAITNSPDTFEKQCLEALLQFRKAPVPRIDLFVVDAVYEQALLGNYDEISWLLQLPTPKDIAAQQAAGSEGKGETMLVPSADAGAPEVAVAPKGALVELATCKNPSIAVKVAEENEGNDNEIKSSLMQQVFDFFDQDRSGVLEFSEYATTFSMLYYEPPEFGETYQFAPSLRLFGDIALTCEEFEYLHRFVLQKRQHVLWRRWVSRNDSRGPYSWFYQADQERAENGTQYLVEELNEVDLVELIKRLAEVQNTSTDICTKLGAFIKFLGLNFARLVIILLWPLLSIGLWIIKFVQEVKDPDASGCRDISAMIGTRFMFLVVLLLVMTCYYLALFSAVWHGIFATDSNFTAIEAALPLVFEVIVVYTIFCQCRELNRGKISTLVKPNESLSWDLYSVTWPVLEWATPENMWNFELDPQELMSDRLIAHSASSCFVVCRSTAQSVSSEIDANTFAQPFLERKREKSKLEPLLFFGMPTLFAVLQGVGPGVWRMVIDKTAFFGEAGDKHIIGVVWLFAAPVFTWLYCFFTQILISDFYDLSFTFESLILMCSSSAAQAIKQKKFVDLTIEDNARNWLAFRKWLVGKGIRELGAEFAVIVPTFIVDLALAVTLAVRLITHNVKNVQLVEVTDAIIAFNVVFISLYLLVLLMSIVQANYVLLDGHLEILTDAERRLIDKLTVTSISSDGPEAGGGGVQLAKKTQAPMDQEFGLDDRLQNLEDRLKTLREQEEKQHIEVAGHLTDMRRELNRLKGREYVHSQLDIIANAKKSVLEADQAIKLFGVLVDRQFVLRAATPVATAALSAVISLIPWK